MFEFFCSSTQKLVIVTQYWAMVVSFTTAKALGKLGPLLSLQPVIQKRRKKEEGRRIRFKNKRKKKKEEKKKKNYFYKRRI